MNGQLILTSDYNNSWQPLIAGTYNWHVILTSGLNSKNFIKKFFKSILFQKRATHWIKMTLIWRGTYVKLIVITGIQTHQAVAKYLHEFKNSKYKIRNNLKAHIKNTLSFKKMVADFLFNTIESKAERNWKIFIFFFCKSW